MASVSAFPHAMTGMGIYDIPQPDSFFGPTAASVIEYMFPLFNIATISYANSHNRRLEGNPWIDP